MYFQLIFLFIEKKIAFLLTYYSSIISRFIVVHLSGAQVGKAFKCNGIPYFQIHPLSNVIIGHNVEITSKIYNNSIGVGHGSIIKVFPNAFLKIGDNVGMSSVRISCSHSISVGDNVLIGADTLIFDSDAHPLNKLERNNPSKIKTKPVTIGPNTFIGAKCIILKGTDIGDGAVIGAGSVVSGKVLSNCIYAGNPAKLIKRIT